MSSPRVLPSAGAAQADVQSADRRDILYRLRDPVDHSSSVDVAIIGAGAAGLATAIFARRAAPAMTVLLLEGARRPGAKILVSGGSRCNVTNAHVGERDFWGGPSAIVRRVLRAFRVEDTVAFFREIGIDLHEEADGKLFPDTNRSRDVLDALMKEVDRVGVRLLTGQRALDVTRAEKLFRITTTSGIHFARTVVLATGGQSLPKTGSDGFGFAIARRLGHTIVPPTPGLVPLLLSPRHLEDLENHGNLSISGVSHEVELTIWEDGRAATRLNGPLLWTHFGVSGPVAMNASRHWLRGQLDGRSVAVTINFRAGAPFDVVDAEWTALALERPKASLQNALGMTVPASVAAALVAALRLDGGRELAHFSRDDRRRLVNALVKWPLPVSGTRGYNYAEVTAGGVALMEINPGSMESRICPGLYFVGEILDVDGRIGGFNFQWAWASGRVAGRALSAH
jgi:predicted Rossmann fold flavoprotein